MQSLQLLIVGPTSEECGGGLAEMVHRNGILFSTLCANCPHKEGIYRCGDDPAWCWEHTDEETRERIERLAKEIE